MYKQKCHTFFIKKRGRICIKRMRCYPELVDTRDKGGVHFRNEREAITNLRRAGGGPHVEASKCAHSVSVNHAARRLCYSIC